MGIEQYLIFIVFKLKILLNLATSENAFLQALETLCPCLTWHLNYMRNWTIWFFYFCFAMRFQQVLQILCCNWTHCFLELSCKEVYLCWIHSHCIARLKIRLFVIYGNYHRWESGYDLKWNIKSYASWYKCGTRRCDLCLTEKMVIALVDPKVLLNKRAELISKCSQRNQYILNSVK